MAYGVATGNLFALLDEENEAVAQQQAPEVKEKPQKTIEKRTVTLGAKPTAAAANSEGKGASAPARGRGYPSRGGRGGGQGRGGFDRPPRDDAPFEAPYEGNREGGGPPRGRGGRGPRGRGGRGEGDGRRRQYERHDGTGRGNETEKRHGAGRGNWGQTGEEEAVEKNEAVEAEAPAAEEEAPAEETAPAEEQEPEPQEMTLEEYEKLMEEKRANLNKRTERKVEVDEAQFKGMKAFTKPDPEEVTDPLELTNKKVIGKNKLGAEKARKEKETVETGFRVGDMDAGRGRRGGRGGGRGYRGAGNGDRYNNSNGDRRGAPAVKIDDESAFPTLG